MVSGFRKKGKAELQTGGALREVSGKPGGKGPGALPRGLNWPTLPFPKIMEISELSAAAWGGLILAAFLIGLAKTGIAGLGVLFVALFAAILPPRVSVGVVLPLLIAGDVFALLLYRRHVQWRSILRLFPTTAVGVVLGYLILGWASDASIGRVIGGILLVLVVLHTRKYWSRQRITPPDDPHVRPWWFSAATGTAAGFTTMTANAAGPVMTLYLLAMRLPKEHFLGTAAVFFFCLNLFKVPFHLTLGTINPTSLTMNLYLIPAVIAGGLVGRLVLPYLKQEWFESIALILTTLAALNLLVFG